MEEEAFLCQGPPRVKQGGYWIQAPKYEQRKEREGMPIVYNKLFTLLSEKGLTPYSLRKEKIIGNATLEKLQKGQGNVDTRSLERLCKYLKCQPGDIMAFSDEETE